MTGVLSCRAQTIQSCSPSRPETGLPGELAVLDVTADAGYDQLVLRSDEATLGFSGAPIWDPELGAVVGIVKSIARRDPGQRLGNTAFGVPADVIRELCPELRLPAGSPYRGLEPFTEEHADDYYGREDATSQLLASLGARSFVAVVAVSGGGKSSLLQAGLAKGLLWDAATQQQIGSAIAVPAVPGGSVGAVALSKNGETLATYGGDGTVRRWDVAYLTDTASDLCTSAGRSLTRAEWAHYVPGLAYRSICP